MPWARAGTCGERSAALCVVGGRTRYAFAVGVGWSGVPNLYETDDDGMGVNNEGVEGKGNTEDMVIDALSRCVRMHLIVVTTVYSPGAS